MRRGCFAFVVSFVVIGSTLDAAGPPWPVFAVDPKVRVKIGDARLHDVISVEGNLFTTSVLTFRDGTGDSGTTKLPGVSAPGEVIVRRAVRTDDVLWAWYQQVLGGDPQKKDVSIVYVGPNGQAAVRFDLVRCFPAAYALHAGAGAMAVAAAEAVTLTCESASRTAP